ncbi:hypothetical protein NB701_001100 [Pantoea ananatis]|nr:hypothetical protein [Pantoea ananatis]
MALRPLLMFSDRTLDPLFQQTKKTEISRKVLLTTDDNNIEGDKAAGQIPDPDFLIKGYSSWQSLIPIPCLLLLRTT